MRLRGLVLTAAAVLASVTAFDVSGQAATDPRALTGVFSSPIEEPGEKCVVNDHGHSICKPAAASIVVLPDGRLLYWDALEGEEDVEYNTVAEYGAVAQNDSSRVLDLRGNARWFRPAHNDGGANPDGGDPEYLPGLPAPEDEPGNNGDLFCSDQVFLADGRVLDVGGTAYYLEPRIPGTGYGVSELEGLKNARIFDARKMDWAQTGSMTYGRWYPSLVTLPDSKVFVASGVTKLIKPIYPDRPMDSGRNVTQTETFDPRTGKWTVNPSSSNRTLPLYPRLHLLPNGHIYYDAAGQTFNPDGQAYDEVLWNQAASYDPKTAQWTDLGVPGINTGGLIGTPGFRGSSFSIMLPLKPPYTSASFLSAGGVAGVTPGTYLATDSSHITSVDTLDGNAITTEATGAFNTPRWYSTAVALPTGEVLAFSGSSQDEVVAPGSGFPVHQAEMFDPASKTWKPLASANHPRTYHNTAVLLADGRVLVGGHAPINTGYAMANNTFHDVAGTSPAFRDPSFEIFSPPYLFRGPRPVIRSAPRNIAWGQRIRIAVPDAKRVSSIVLVRNPALTHLIDGDQRTVELPVISRDGGSVTVFAPPNGAVAPKGPYLLFVNAATPDGPVPSLGYQLFVR